MHEFLHGIALPKNLFLGAEIRSSNTETTVKCMEDCIGFAIQEIVYAKTKYLVRNIKEESFLMGIRVLA